MTTTWNSADKSTSITLSTDKLTVTGTASGSGAGAGVRSVATIGATDKIYAEFTQLATSNDDWIEIGVANATWNFDTSYLGQDNNGICYETDSGKSWLNDTSQGSLGVSANGANFAIAVDRGNNKFWVKVGGVWKGGTSPNPATNSGGISISAITGTLYMAATCGATGNSFVSRFAASSWVDAAPTGFTEISPTAGASVGTAHGTSTVSGIGASKAVSTYAVAGTSAVNGVSKTSTTSLWAIAGTSTANATGQSIKTSVGVAAGTSSTNFVSIAFLPTFHVAGTSTVTGVSGAKHSSTFNIAGTSTAQGVSPPRLPASQGAYGVTGFSVQFGVNRQLIASQVPYAMAGGNAKLFHSVFTGSDIERIPVPAEVNHVIAKGELNDLIIPYEARDLDDTR